MNSLGSKGLQNSIPGGANPSGILLDFPTGQQYTSYRTGDEGSRMQNGWNDYTIPVLPEAIAQLDHSLAVNYWWRLVNPLTVAGVSSVVRFVDVDGGQTFSATGNKNLITIDKLTGLGFYRITADLGGTVTWNNAIDNALAFSTTVNGVTYSDWYLVSFSELLQIFGEIGSINGTVIRDNVSSADIFTMPSSQEFWTSTTQSNSIGNAYSKGWNPTTYQRPSGKTSVFHPIYIFDARALITA